MAPLLQRSLTWASTYGNHDHNFNISGAGVLAREMRWPNSTRTRSMVPGRNAGTTNYYLPVYAPGCMTCNCTPELLLWFFDSRGGFYFRKRDADGDMVGQPDWVDTSVVDWFQLTNAKFTARFGKIIPSLAFVHIPVSASAAIQAENGRGSIDSNRQPGINDDYPLSRRPKAGAAMVAMTELATMEAKMYPLCRLSLRHQG